MALGAQCIGSPMPALLLWAFKTTGSLLAPAGVVMSVAFVSFWVMAALQKQTAITSVTEK
jgi:hypothetical protein